ncbi:uncharacterized protein LOC107274184 isoform X2 [Cephus cinctus]|uniref:Uncharacterized protein LOC107274184 isoform X2 n=1 Tax=Cephus cinctus TaxID=211228 RepID=A0AAJ7RVI4_CEPCN|nr:uncharacterized protein LOC107274184 isoform X2 [Cephus cinctus]
MYMLVKSCYAYAVSNDVKMVVYSQQLWYISCAVNVRQQTEMEQTKDTYLRHLFDGDPIFNVYKKEVTNLSVGAPGPDVLKQCGLMMMRATQHRLEEEEQEGNYYLFQYGITSGLWECREELAKFLGRRYGDPVAREQLILTCGATHGLQLLLCSILSSNGVIFVEEVTYMIALDAFNQFPLMRIVIVPMKDDLVDLDEMEKILQVERKGNYFLNKDKIFWGMFYTIPTYHNPTGMTLPPEDCKRLVKIARENSIVVVCDDVYNLLHYGDGLPPHRLFYYDNPKDPDYKGGNVISNGSFSKILFPAIRLGWLESSHRITEILKASGILKSGGAVNHYISGLITSLLQMNIEDEYLDSLVTLYKERLNALCDVLDRFLPKCCSYRRPQGVDAAKFIPWCQEVYKVSAIPGSRFSNTKKTKNFLRLSIAFHPTERLTAAGKALCEALLQYIRSQTDTSEASTCL